MGYDDSVNVVRIHGLGGMLRGLVRLPAIMADGVENLFLEASVVLDSSHESGVVFRGRDLDRSQGR